MAKLTPIYYNLTLQQQDIYFEQLMFPSDPIYNIGAIVKIKGKLDLDALKKAYEKVIEDHDSCRILIESEKEVPYFYIAKTNTNQLEYLNYSETDNAEQLATEYLKQCFKKSFNFSGKKLLHRFILVKIADDFHFLYSVFHHIVTDGWGTSLIYKRLIHNYNQIMNYGNISTEIPLKYTAYVESDQSYRTSSSYCIDQEYWKEKELYLQDSLIQLKSCNKGNQSLRKEYNIDRITYNRLSALSSELNVSNFPILLGILTTYLGRFYHSNHISLGIPILNRTNSSFKQTVGTFVGMIPFSLKIDFEDTFIETLNKIKINLKNDYRHQRFPLGKLINDLKIFDAREQLYNIILSYEKHDFSAHFDNTITTVAPLTNEFQNVALAISIREFDNDSDVRIDFDYNVSYFDEFDISQFSEHFHLILKKILINPNQKLKEIVFLNEEDKKVQFNTDNLENGYTNDSDNITIVDLFRRQVSLHEKKIAATDGFNNLSYKQLEDKSNVVAQYISCFVEDITPIAVMLNRSLDLLIIILGIFKSGRSYIPLDPSFPQDRLEYIIKNSECKTLVYNISTEVNERNLDLFKVRKISAENLLTCNIEGPSCNRPLPEDTAYIIYTSGSTGDPKGVEIGHKSLTNFMLSMAEVPGINVSDIFYAVTTYSFDISILEFFLPILNGAKVFIASNNLLSNPNKLIESIEKISPSIIQATPSFYQMLFNAGWAGNTNLKVLCGGDLISPALAKKLIDSCRSVWNMYGPTETTIWSSFKQVTSMKDNSNIGKPIRNTTFAILDNWMNNVPIGSVGNIYISGDGLAKGYFNNRQLSSERFLHYNGKIYYNTGDVGKWNNNGEIVFLGRKDLQVKIRGYRVELGDIESNLLKNKNVEEVVVVSQNVNNAAILVAYVKVKNDYSEDDLRAFARKFLPEYMIPTIFKTIDKFPLTPNNKIDRKTLSHDISFKDVLSEEVALPNDEIEKEVLKLWKAELLQDELGVNDNFFHVGGHSLNATSVIYRLNKKFSTKLSLSDVFNSPTVRTLSDNIRLQMSGENFESKIKKTRKRKYYDITHSQKNIWISSQKTEASISYNMPMAYQVKGNIDIDRMEKAILSVISDHESLRTNFIEYKGRIVQRIKPASEIRFRLLSSTVGDNNQVQTKISELLHKQFDLEKDLLVRLHLIKSEDKSILLFVSHHIIMDGWSLEVLINSLKDHYNEKNNVWISGRASILQFKDYSDWKNSQPKNLQAAQYWQAHLKNYLPKQTFRGVTNINNNKYSGDLHQFSFNKEETSFLKNAACTANVSLFTYLVSSLCAFIRIYSDIKDVCVGLTVTGRNSQSVSDTIGMFVNTIPLRIQINEQDSFRNLIVRINDHMLQMHRYSDYPVSELYVGNAQPFNVLIAYQNPEFSLDCIEGFRDFELKSFTYINRNSRFPITFDFHHNRYGYLCYNLEYDTRIYSKTIIETIVLKFKAFLKSVSTNSFLDINDYDLTTSEEEELKSAVEINFNF